MNVVRILLVVLSLASGQAFARDADLVDPAPIAVPAGKSSAAVLDVIKRAMVGRHFAVESQTPGKIVGRLAPRKHVVRVTISWDASQIRIAYLSSENMDYTEKDGRRVIHNKYNKWVDSLADDIKVSLSAL